MLVKDMSLKIKVIYLLISYFFIIFKAHSNTEDKTKIINHLSLLKIFLLHFYKATVLI